MKPSEIKVGKTYKNSGAGRTRRTVLDIGLHIVPDWPSPSTSLNEPAVKYRQGNNERVLYLCSFAKWAGGLV